MKLFISYRSGHHTYIGNFKPFLPEGKISCEEEEKHSAIWCKWKAVSLRSKKRLFPTTIL